MEDAELSSRVISTILSIIETDAYLMWKCFHHDGRNWDHTSFTEELAMQLLSIPEDETSPNVSLDSSADVDTLKGHEIRPMSELEQYKGQISSGKSRVPLRRCRMCGVVLGDINIMAFDYCDLIIGRF